MSWLRHRTVVAAIVCVVAWAAWSGWQAVSAPGRISPGLRAALEREHAIPRLRVELGFTPSDFHMNVLQEYGAVGGMTGHGVILLGVPAAAVWRLAHVFWVRYLDVKGG